jgi:hypothetical protein
MAREEVSATGPSIGSGIGSARRKSRCFQIRSCFHDQSRNTRALFEFNRHECDTEFLKQKRDIRKIEGKTNTGNTDVKKEFLQLIINAPFFILESALPALHLIGLHGRRVVRYALTDLNAKL